MLVHITCRFTKRGELWVKCGVFHYVNGKFSVYFKPLGPFTPLGEFHLRGHVGVVAATTYPAWVIECANEAMFGLQEVEVGGGEIVKGNARFGEEDKPLVGNIEQRIGEKSSFGVAHAHLSPFRNLKKKKQNYRAFKSN